MIATMTDDRRRVVLPPECPAKSPVTIQPLDGDSWIVRRQRPHGEMLVVLEPDVKRLRDDPEMDALAESATRSQKLPPFDEL
jgi:hypothetical protein